MKKLYALIISLAFVATASAQWPANYGGVMLQGFYWNSFEDTKLTTLNSQGAVLKDSLCNRRINA